MFHALGGVPFTSHQKLKIQFRGKVITLETDEASTIAVLQAEKSGLWSFSVATVKGMMGASSEHWGPWIHKYMER